MSKLREAWTSVHVYNNTDSINMDAAITEAEARIEALESVVEQRNEMCRRLTIEKEEAMERGQRYWQAWFTEEQRRKQIERERDEARETIVKIQKEFHRFCVTHKKVVDERDEALAKVERMDVALKWYEETFCEGFESGCGHFTNDCSGCMAHKARAARKEPTI